jgi:hypothetical protein
MPSIPDAVKTLLSTLIAAIASVGFVAFVGAAIVWERFSALGLPADQSVAAVPRSHLVAVGATALVTFAILGLVAVIAVYFIDPRGRPKRRMHYGLLALLTVELVVVVVRADFRGCELTKLLVGLAIVAVVLGWLVYAGFALWRMLPAGQRTPAKLLRGMLGVRHAVLVLVVLGLTIALVATESWLAMLLLAAVVLALLNLGVAHATGDRFALYGVAVFASVAVFGGIASFVEARDTPKVQPVAVLRSDDPRGLCALFVGETDERMYLGRVDLEPGSATDSKPAEGSGRLFWLPKDKLAAWSIGTLQSIGRAKEQAIRLRDELVAERAPVTATAGAQATKAAAVEPEPIADLCSPGGRQAAQISSRERTLARQFQPLLVVDRNDLFWPTSITAIYGYRGGRGRNARTCLKAPGGDCKRVTRAQDIPWLGADNEWLEYPAADTSKDEQAEMARRALGSSNPYSTAQMYFLTTGGRGKRRLTSLQYWFYYPFNYQRLPGRFSAGYHEGDFESTGVLLSSQKKRPVYVWTARHDGEGERFAFGEPGLQHAGDHVRVFAARGSHATYTTCGRQRRPYLAGAIDDQTSCPKTNPLVFEPRATPLFDLARAPWACFSGHFGHTSARPGKLMEVRHALVADGPRSPLWQQVFGPSTATPCTDVGEPPDRGSPDEEEATDETTAQRIRNRAGALTPLFSSCVFWRQRPTRGGYVTACDPGVLDRFFRSGLETRGPERIRITSAGGTVAKTLPAVLRTQEPTGIDGAAISSRATTRPEIYAARYVNRSSGRLLAADFGPVPIAPGRPLTLQTSGDKRWYLVDGSQRVASAKPRPGGAAPAAGAKDLSAGADAG